MSADVPYQMFYLEQEFHVTESFTSLALCLIHGGDFFSHSEKKRERGNELFGREDYSGAINSYSK